MRRVMLTVHLFSGLFAALFLLALGVSGSLVAFEGEIDRALNPRLTWIEPGVSRLSLNKLVEKLETTYPGYHVSGIQFSPLNNATWSAFLTGDTKGSLAVAFNPYDGSIVGDQSKRNNFTGRVHQFHLHLLAGKAGGDVGTAAAAFLLLLALTGLVIWWPRKLLKVSWRGPWKKLNFDAHQVLGLYTSFFLLVFALTAIVIHWDNELQRIINHASGSQGEPSPPRFKPLQRSGETPNFDGLLAVAQKAEPDARVNSMTLDTDPVRISMQHPGDNTPSGRTIVLVDAHTGSIFSIVDWRTGSPGFRLVKYWNREIHTGDFGGLPTRILACAVSLSLPLMAITGPLIWWNRRRRARPSNQSAAVPVN